MNTHLVREFFQTKIDLYFYFSGPDFRTPLIIAVEDPNLITIVDNLLDYEADPMICDQEGLNAIDHVANHEMRQMLLNYVEQSTRGQKNCHFNKQNVIIIIWHTLHSHTLYIIGVKVRNMNMYFNTGGTWRRVGQ